MTFSLPDLFDGLLLLQMIGRLVERDFLILTFFPFLSFSLTGCYECSPTLLGREGFIEFSLEKYGNSIRIRFKNGIREGR